MSIPAATIVRASLLILNASSAKSLNCGSINTTFKSFPRELALYLGLDGLSRLECSPFRVTSTDFVNFSVSELVAVSGYELSVVVSVGWRLRECTVIYWEVEKVVLFSMWPYFWLTPSTSSIDVGLHEAVGVHVRCCADFCFRSRWITLGSDPGLSIYIQSLF